MFDPDVTQAIKPIGDMLNADVYLYSGRITAERADTLISVAKRAADRRPNVALILTTYGGDPAAAYRMARFLRRCYTEFTLYVFGHCKSAGTLLALGATEIVMSDFGELGPLDIQLAKDDDLMSMSSGLEISQALATLTGKANEMFQEIFIQLIAGTGGRITTKTAADIATSLTVGLLSPISEQIDPLRLGYQSRACLITKDYGSRLTDNSEAIDQLLYGYPSHDFNVDVSEAARVLENVRSLHPIEETVEHSLKEYVRTPHSVGIVHRFIFAEEPPKENNGHESESEHSAQSPEGEIKANNGTNAARQGNDAARAAKRNGKSVRG